MASGLEDSASKPTPSYSSNGLNETAGDFECNICFELAQDPIITLCGHLFCWPCLYRWLHHHSQSQECPVCKGLIQEEKLVPLYGRGKSTTDPRSRPIPGVEIPNRPSGQRRETAPPPPPNQGYFTNIGFGFLGGFMPMATARFGNMTMSAGFGGLFPSLLSFQFNGFPDATMYGATHGFPFGYPQAVHGVNVHRYQRPASSNGQDTLLRNLLLLVGFLVLLTFIWS